MPSAATKKAEEAYNGQHGHEDGPGSGQSHGHAEPEHSHQHGNGCSHEESGHGHGHGHSHGYGGDSDDESGVTQLTEAAALQELDAAEVHAVRSEQLLKEERFDHAAAMAERALKGLPLMARAALTRGRALLHPALNRVIETNEMPEKALLEEAMGAFMLSARLNPECEETKHEIENLQVSNERVRGVARRLYFVVLPLACLCSLACPLMLVQGLVRELVSMAENHAPPPAMPTGDSAAGAESQLDVIIVGAGAAGVGCALMLTKTFGLDPSRVLLVERGEAVGETFRRWPAEMRFISPSFNQQGWTSSFDLNSIAHGTSPAYSLHNEHPSGDEYADYLHVLAKAAELRVLTMTEVVSVQALGEEGGPSLFSVGVSATTKPFHESRILHTKPGHGSKPSKAQKLTARYVVWAAGEFQYPATESASAVEGAELCMHNSMVRSWANLPGDDFVLIGGCVTTSLRDLP